MMVGDDGGSSNFKRRGFASSNGGGPHDTTGAGPHDATNGGNLGSLGARVE
ncbi:hypothetical protein DEO72_LG8g1851 [Vigna unguiculata]|uniref:Uncharacterized protein n=1 Tax=Vigna unguiculata TaxID=3917 RepID=A0A4D6MQW9_VIGUN|nr:hypothetical protein DEO72_LG8g1851 [Vigna unguiculata]